MVENRQLSGKVKVLYLIAELKRKYSLGIIKGRAWRVKNIDEEIIEGDSTKQYSFYGVMVYNLRSKVMEILWKSIWRD